ncbi:MAG TPA: aldo/keto reductase [Candidatus Dormibacteraeota bacterium]|nr:aldo/keto reductase [Candidatus Dormibacteraeota bacterium]
MIARAEFGRTGHQSTRIVFGAAALGSVSQDVADQALDLLLEHGVNHIDTAASYGESELRIKPWLKREPGRFFLATKTGKRDEKGAREELHRSLDRLGVDHVDLWQLHSLADPIEWDQALSPGGALDAALRARDERLVKWIGVTGHGAQIAATHRRSLERFDFDSVLLPYNFATMRSPYYRENFDALVKTCEEQRVAVQTIKSIALRPWMDHERTRTTWYEPLESAEDVDLAVWWALGRKGVFVDSVGDVNLLHLVLEAAEDFSSAPADEEMQALLERTQSIPLFV